MGTHHRASFVTAAVTCLALVAPVFMSDAHAQVGQGRGRWQNSGSREAYDRGFQEGLRQGERDVRQNRSFDLYGDPAYRAGDRGYNARFGDRNVYRTGYRSGFEDGYRNGYGRPGSGRIEQRDIRRPGIGSGRPPLIVQEPAVTRGFNDGYERGLQDGRDGDRYDPVATREYRSGENGYTRSYGGTRDAYKNNYRAGFRQGYEDGYRDATRFGRR